MTNIEDGKTFCYAPFVHLYLQNNEHHRVCCSSLEFNNVKPNTKFDLKERWSDEYYKDIRTKMLSGIPLPQCNGCYKKEAAGVHSDRLMFNNIFKYRDIELNIETGNQYNTPLDLDLRPGNLCNLKCRMCGPWASSQYAKELEKHYDTLSFAGDNIKNNDIDWATPENLKFLLENVNQINRIKFLGGEPTIMPEVHSLIDHMIENRMFDTQIHFTTNLTNDNTAFIEKISKFKNISFSFSIDGIEDTIEYIRTPINWKTIEKNIKTYSDISKYTSINFTWQEYNFFHLEQFLKWLDNYNSNNKFIRLNLETLKNPNWASFLCFDLELRNNYLERLLNSDVMKSDHYNETVVPVLEDALNDTTTYDMFKFVDATKRFDKVRNQHIKDYIPYVWDIIKNDYERIVL